ncbi:hypothetical protein FGO68_gene8448 [Halteria grandinella]|uniref:Uncharacterized protein n=1 Tax=Halteria grandinella TaxID=5974 RepID=A0A8J8T3W6_HALGN|nr:hypothetical protein FGO68_gene8448 [Halteria grandinella]
MALARDDPSLAEIVLGMKVTQAKSLQQQFKHLDETTQLKSNYAILTSLFGGIEGASQIFKVLIDLEKRIRRLENGKSVETVINEAVSKDSRFADNQLAVVTLS